MRRANPMLSGKYEQLKKKKKFWHGKVFFVKASFHKKFFFEIFGLLLGLGLNA